MPTPPHPNSDLPGLLLIGLLTIASAAHAAAAPKPDPETPNTHDPVIEEVGRFDLGGAYALFGDTYQFSVESQAQIGLRIDRDWLLLYRHRDWTPFVNGDQFGRIQPDILTLSDELRLYRALSQRWAVGLALRNTEAYAIDRPGGSSLAAVGPAIRYNDRIGAYALRAEVDLSPVVDGDGPADGDLVWQTRFQVERPLSKVWPVFWNVDQAALRLAVDAEGIAGAPSDPFTLRVGPELVFPTRQGNDLSLFAHYWTNQNHPFAATQDEDATLLGIAVSSPAWGDSLDTSTQVGKLQGAPSIGGRYDLGFSSDFWLSQFDLYGDAFTFEAFTRPWSFVIDYSHRRKLGFADEDPQNTAYWVMVGLETPLPWAPTGVPVIAGLDFTHRSDHALDVPKQQILAPGAPLDPNVDRIQSTDINVFPRLRLETADYSDPVPHADLLRKRGWIGHLAWQVSGGWDFEQVDESEPFSGRVALRSDLIGLGAYLLYLEGAAGSGSETPEWSVESGLRGSRHRAFVRFEDWGIPSRLGGEQVGMIGAGWHF